MADGSAPRTGVHLRGDVLEVRLLLQRTRRLAPGSVRAVEVVRAPGPSGLTVGSLQLALVLADGTRVAVPAVARYATLDGEARLAADAQRLRAALGLPRD